MEHLLFRVEEERLRGEKTEFLKLRKAHRFKLGRITP